MVVAAAVGSVSALAADLDSRVKGIPCLCDQGVPALLHQLALLQQLALIGM
jgi:hypothetical protein